MAEKRKDKKGRILRDNEIQRDNGLYIFSYIDIYGTRKQISSWKLVPTDKVPIGKRECISLREREECIAEDKREGIDSASKKRVTLNEVFDNYIESKKELKESTRGNYIFMYDRYIREKLGKFKISDIKYSDVKKFYQGLLNGEGTKRTTGFQPNSLEIIHTILHPTFTYAQRDNLINRNPTDGVMGEIKKSRGWETPHRHALTEEQQYAFMNFVYGSEIYRHWGTLFTFLLGTGCRVGETIGLTWDDVDFKRDEININHNLIYRKSNVTGECEMHITTPKTKKGTRTIPMLKDVRKVLLQLKEEQFSLGVKKDGCVIDNKCGFVFLNRNGYVHNPQTINRAIKRIVLAYNAIEREEAHKEGRDPVYIPDFSVHQLRHTFCTRYCENETNIKLIQEIMGHADITTTMNIYAEATETKKKESMESIEGKIFIRPVDKIG